MSEWSGMYDNSSGNPTNQQGDNTPPPMLDTPMSNDPPGDDNMSSTNSDQPSGDEQFTPSQTYQSDNNDSPGSNQQPDDLVNPSDSPAGGNDELLNIKRQALQQLTPLVDHLEQSPKEQFRTTMMMIQATDNQGLIKKAFDAAQKIEDDKERAQAFLDIINEINYFTTQHQE